MEKGRKRGKIRSSNERAAESRGRRATAAMGKDGARIISPVSGATGSRAASQTWARWFRKASKGLFAKLYPERDPKEFRCSYGWFRNFLTWHQISLRSVTNIASKLPRDFGDSILTWMRYNRRNSQLREGDQQRLSNYERAVGRYHLQNICNMDQTPLPFEYLEGQTYNAIRDKTIWLQSTRSGWDKRQGTIQLTIFADGIPRVALLIFFRGKGIGPSILTEQKLYDPRVVVKFNPTAYANSTNMVEWLETQLIPVLDCQPTLLDLDLFAGHKTEEVLDTFKAHDITVSVIPAGCTGIVQPLDVLINRPFKDILKVSIN